MACTRWENAKARPMKRRSRTSDFVKVDGISAAKADAVNAMRNSTKDDLAVARIALRVPATRSGFNARMSTVIVRIKTAKRLNSCQPWIG